MTLQATVCWFHRVTTLGDAGSYWCYQERCQKGSLLQTGIRFSGGVQLLVLPSWVQRHPYRQGLQQQNPLLPSEATWSPEVVVAVKEKLWPDVAGRSASLSSHCCLCSQGDCLGLSLWSFILEPWAELLAWPAWLPCGLQRAFARWHFFIYPRDIAVGGGTWQDNKLAGFLVHAGRVLISALCFHADWFLLNVGQVFLWSEKVWIQPTFVLQTLS